MGWNGIGIGWPNATSGGAPIPLRSGWFIVAMSCNGGEFESASTIYVSNVDWQQGQYVYSNDLSTRVLLGAFYESDPDLNVQFNVEGPAYNDCG